MSCQTVSTDMYPVHKEDTIQLDTTNNSEKSTDVSYSTNIAHETPINSNLANDDNVISPARFGDTSIPNILNEAKAREICVATSPLLASARQDVTASSGRTMQEQLLSNPTISSEIENIAGNDGGFNSAEVTIEIHQEIPINGVRALSAKAGIQEQMALWWEYETQRRLVDSEAYWRFYQILMAEQRVRQLQLLVKTRCDFSEKILALVQHGKQSQSLLLQAEIGKATAQMNLEESQNILHTNKNKLASYLHIPVTNLPPCEGSLTAWEQALPSLDMLTSKLQDNPQLKRLRLEQNQLQTQRLQTTASNIPNPEIFIGAKREFADEQNTLKMGIEFPLPLWNRQQGRLAELEALERKTWYAENATLETLHAELLEAYQTCQYSQKKLENYQKKIVPATQQTVQLIETNYEQGKATIAEILSAKQIEIELQLEILDELNNFYQAKVIILRLCGD